MTKMVKDDKGCGKKRDHFGMANLAVVGTTASLSSLTVVIATAALGRERPPGLVRKLASSCANTTGNRPLTSAFKQTCLHGHCTEKGNKALDGNQGKGVK